MAAYCTKDDLLLGDLPIPDYISADRAVADAADEIDSRIGFIYKTPIDTSDSGPVLRPARLLLKRLNAFVASGRLLMNIATAAEDTRVNSYAARLLREADETLKAIEIGQLILDGAERIRDDGEIRGPIIGNKDPESYVEAFYDRVVNPNYGVFNFGLESERGLI